LRLHGIDRPKRIVTGLRPDGTSYFARVEEVDEIDYAAVYPDSVEERPAHASRSHRMWAWDALPSLPHDGLAPRLDAPVTDEDVAATLGATSAFPPLGGARINLVKFPPIEPGQPPRRGRLHWHNTVDLQWLIAGELVIRLDDDSEVTMRPGDLIVQHGTNHAWDVTTEGAVLAVVIFSAERTGIEPPVPDRHSGTARPVER
jgi:quercetin dioxygenase-like cupin family protein